MIRPFMSILLVALSAACAGDVASDRAPAEPVAVETEAAVETAEEEKPMEDYTNKVAEIRTTLGTITVRFFPDKAPNHVRNFIDLAEQGFYDGVRFHRVVPGFVIQGGDPNTKTENRRSWGSGGSGRNLTAEFNDVPHKRGILSMARSGHPDSASSQFFIMLKDTPYLDGQYTVFGEVVSGMEVADQIVAAAQGKELPDDPVRIETVTVRAAS